ncbi:hypothetical protein [Armatimonas rosea]|uniref:Uncharacterized protein n=1 Tax=Armatimonas rosea TaxID=685828 RepID=A0A7W9SQA7_ARMRO|nr:hypothetical protein [Armatimonas rosea]MBB6050861.1 hypothetical protein [Armatimonas rosea]
MRLADGELRGLKALTLRRHVKQCPECTQTLTELGRVDTLLKSTDHFPPETRQNALPLRPIGLVGSAALLAGAALLFAIPGGPLRPTSSFAQVEAAMGRIHTAHWTSSITSVTYLNGKKQGYHSVMDCWVDLDTHRLSYRKIKSDPINPSDGIRMDQADFYVDEKAQWSVDHGSVDTYVRMDPVWAQSNKSLVEYLRESIVLPQSDPQHVEVLTVQGQKQQYTFSAWKQSDAQWQGQRALKYTRTVTFGDGAQTRPQLVTIWVDPKTMRLLRRDTRQERDSNPQLAYSYNTTSENFRYNETPPPGTFDLPIPKVGQRFSLGKAMENPQLQRDNDPAVAALARQVMECFSQRDADRLFALWDTEGVPEAEWRARQDNWRRKLASPAFGKSLAYESSEAYAVPLREFVRKSEAEPFPPQPLPCRDVTIKGWLTMEKAPHPYLVFAWARFIQREGQWRIQDLHELEETSTIKNGTIVMQRRYKK